jgi:hypothetical protein
MDRRPGSGTRVGAALLLLLLTLEAPGTAFAIQATAEQAREVRTVWTGEFGLSRPGGLAYSPDLHRLFVAGVRERGTAVLRLGFDEDPHGWFRLPRLADLGTLAFDQAGGRLTAIDGDQLIAAASRDLRSDRPSVDRTSLDALDLRDPRSATFDPETGTWFVLDAGAEVLVEVPEEGGTAEATRIPLSDLGITRYAGIAFNPSDGLLYVAGADPHTLFALDRSGATVRTLDLGSLALQDPTAIVFAPSSDPTDDPATLDLFIADRGGAQTAGGVTEVTLVQAPTLSAPVVAATLVRTIDTSRFSPGSPDPSGIVYLPGPDRLEVTDSEVDETTGAGYHGVNLWRITRTGTATDTGTTLAYSDEPTGLGFDKGGNRLFISDDDRRRVFVVRPGPDARFGTTDDLVSSINAEAYGSTDTEDPQFDPATGHLFFLDGVATEVYEIDPVDGVFGDGDDRMTHFDVGAFGPADWEGLGSDQATGDLLVGARVEKKIYEVTKSGSLVRIIDASGISGMRYLSGLGMAPASDDASRMDYWIVDRGVDNGDLKTENDGKIFELKIGSTNRPPTVTNPGTKTNVVGDLVSYQVVASDPDGDAITKYGATGLPTGLSVDTATGSISGTVTAAGTFTVTISATDSRGATGSATFTWTVMGSSSVLAFGPAADTYVRSDRPNENFGSRPGMTADASPIQRALLKFTVSGIGTRTVKSVKLRVYCIDGSSVGGAFYPVADTTWQENTVTWNTEPAAGANSLASLGSVSRNVWYEVNLTSLVTHDGTYSLRIASTSADAVRYSTKERSAGFPSSLVVTLA